MIGGVSSMALLCVYADEMKGLSFVLFPSKDLSLGTSTDFIPKVVCDNPRLSMQIMASVDQSASENLQHNLHIEAFLHSCRAIIILNCYNCPITFHLVAAALETGVERR